MQLHNLWVTENNYSKLLADLAVTALIEEAELTPKPALVDMENTGAHDDLSVELMRLSANVLHPTFAEIARVSYKRTVSQELREEIAMIGREGEKNMLEATDGVNTHRGGIWALGLLVSATAMSEPGTAAKEIADVAGKLSRFEDRFAPVQQSNGLRVKKQYGAIGARGEANLGFPHVIHEALPALYKARNLGVPETYARLDALLAVIGSLDDTCILHRGGPEALEVAKRGATTVLERGGSSTPSGFMAYQKLDNDLLSYNASPGGSADLLAAALFIDSVRHVRVYSERVLQVENRT
ncbi:triphosphoribosyl-dephospho-CoA synthase [Bacillus sp. FJAT-45350]|uniref:triphosphoribosyl-dephospho-CoA synthase n=1 Tax=Bacillus sp. FJAT-45350 TaxID=2011014 RepID=UPI000BB969C9|nr:triphosphoribosyl-dephospho-CoA synthase [Bacillus sp. FJAT-45350]